MAIKDLLFSIIASDKTGPAFASVRRGLSGLDRAAASTAERIGRIGQSMRGLGRGMTINTAPLSIGLGAAMKTAGDFEATMNRVRSVTGATGADFDALRAQAKALGARTKFSASEAAEGMAFLGMAGFEANEIVKALPGTLQLAAAAQMDLADSADIVSNVLTGYGLEVEQVGRLNDVMVATMTKANTDLRQLGDAFKYVGPVANSVGVEIELTAAILGKLGDAGIQGEMGGTALRGAITKLINPTAEAARVLDSLGVSVKDSSGSMRSFEDILTDLEPHAQNTADMMTIFGQRAGPAMMALLGGGTDAIFELRSELEKAGGTAEQVAGVQMQGFNGEMAKLRAAMEALAIAIGDSGILEALTGFVQMIAGAITALSEFSPAALKVGTVVVGLVAVLGPLLVTGGLVVSVFGSAAAVLGALAAPVAGAVAGFVALTAAVVAFWPEIKAAAAAVVNGLGVAVDAVVGFGSAAMGVFSAVPEYVGAMVSRVKDFLGSKLNAAFDAAKDGLEKLKGAFWSLYDAVVGNSYVPDMVDGVAAEMKRLDGEMVDVGVASIDKLEGAFAGLFGDVTGGLKDMARNGTLSFQGFADSLLDAGLNLADRMLDQVWNQIASDMAGALSGVGGGGGAGFGGSGGGVVSGLIGGFGNMLMGALPGFNNGASFTAGGRGGIDRNVTMFRHTAGEQVTVTPRNAAPAARPVYVTIQTPNPAAFQQSRAQVGGQIARAVAAGNRAS